VRTSTNYKAHAPFYTNITKLFLLVIVLNTFLYYFVSHFYYLVPINQENYFRNAHHYIPENRVTGKVFNLTNGLAIFDAQWYLKIADSGYPAHPQIVTLDNKSMDGLTYAFFPLYPLLIKCIAVLTNRVEPSAFILSNVLLVINFFSLYFVLGKLTNQPTRVRTILLLFFFPFSIFFRSYFSENLFLTELIWLSYFLCQKRYYSASMIIGLASITRGAGLFLVPIIPILLYCEHNLFRKPCRTLAYLSFMATPPLLWSLYCLNQTGNLLFFYTIRQSWNGLFFPLTPLYNLSLLAGYFGLPLHSFHFSRIDSLSVLLVLILLIKSKKLLSPELWLISFFLWLGPLLTTDTMSFTRYQIVSFPLFLYLAHRFGKYQFMITFLMSYLSLLIVSLYFVNWYWLG
jgi:Gpi18-like mannosyltransferase